MDSPFLIYVQYVMIVGGILPLSLINSYKRIYILYRYTTLVLMVLFIFFLFGGTTNFSGSKEMLFKYINDRVIFIVVYVKLALSMSEDFEKLIYEMITYEAKLVDIGDEELLKINKIVVKKSKVVQVFVISNIFVCWVAFIVPGFIDYAEVQAAEGSANCTLKTYSVKPYELWVPFEENEHYLLLLFVQGYYAFMGGSIYCAIQIVIINMLLCITLRLQVLSVNIKNMNKDIGMLNVKERIRIYAKEHIDIIR